MTHDELLDKIAQSGLKPDGNVMPTHLVLALHEVAELHKPHEVMGLLHCKECREGYNESVLYPCTTIQAIEKELG
jgi:hypothetical protein